MVSRRLGCGVLTCALLTLGGIAQAQTASAQNQSSNANQVTVPFSDPSRPGIVKVNLLGGGITVRAGAGRDVIVTTSTSERDADEQRERERERERERNRPGSGDDPDTAGLRRLTQPEGVNITEENNTVTVSSGGILRRANVLVQVPPATSLVLSTVTGGAVTVDGINGSIEVNNVNGSIRITDAGGPVIAHATNGRVVVTLKQVVAGKPMSFTSFNGNVDVTLPASAKANLKLRSDRGDVYTDFDIQTTNPPPRTATRPNDDRDDRARDRDSRDNPRYRVEMDRAIYGSINGGGADFELRTFNGNIYLRKGK